MRIVEFLVKTGIAKSNREAKELIEAGAIKINYKKVDDRTNNIFINDNKIILTN